MGADTVLYYIRGGGIDERKSKKIDIPHQSRTISERQISFGCCSLSKHLEWARTRQPAFGTFGPVPPPVSNKHGDRPHLLLLCIGLMLAMALRAAVGCLRVGAPRRRRTLRSPATRPSGGRWTCWRTTSSGRRTAPSSPAWASWPAPSCSTTVCAAWFPRAPMGVCKQDSGRVLRNEGLLGLFEPLISTIPRQ